MNSPNSLFDETGDDHVVDSATHDTIMADCDEGGTPPDGMPDGLPSYTQENSEATTDGDVSIADGLLGDGSHCSESLGNQSYGNESLGNESLDNEPPGSRFYSNEPNGNGSCSNEFNGNEAHGNGSLSSDLYNTNFHSNASQDDDDPNEDTSSLEREDSEETVYGQRNEEMAQHPEQEDQVMESIEDGHDASGNMEVGAIDFSMFEEPEQAIDHTLEDLEHKPESFETEISTQPPVFRSSSSLFVPEGGDPSPSETLAMPPPARPLPIRSSANTDLQLSEYTRQTSTPFRHSVTPFRPSATPSRSTRSLFSMVRNSMSQFNKRKAAMNNNDASDTSLLSSAASRQRSANDQDDVEDSNAIAEFKRQKQYYKDLKAKNDGKLSFKQELEWFQITKKEEARCEKRRRDLLLDQEADGDNPDLFPEISYENQTSPEREDDCGNTFEFPGRVSHKRQRTTKSSGAPRTPSMQEAEFESMWVALNADKDSPGKKSKGRGGGLGKFGSSRNGSSSKVKPKKPKAKNAPRPAGEKPGRMTAKEKRAADTARTQINSLFNSNVFDQQASEDAAEQPSFQSGVKADALKELIAGFSNNTKEYRHEAHALNNATKDFNGRGSVKADRGMWRVKGMSTSLKGYQLLGSAWMRRRENGVLEPRGGLLADQMGLGKTLMMLANIVNGRPAKSETGPKTTLLVASPALLEQWASEIEKHTDCDLSVMRYSSGNRVDSNRTSTIIDGHDIVLTTWGEVRRSYPKWDPPADCETHDQKREWWEKEYEKRGKLHRIQFLRVVLDEAQAIKNHKSQTSLGCRGLMATHKWAVSGTPILNGLFELYPYFKFIGVPHTGDFEDFEQNYCNAANGTDRLLVRLSQFMLRRTHSDKMFGAPILKLPRAHQSTYWTDFNPVERMVYEIVFKRFIARINTWVDTGELKNEKRGPGSGKKDSEKERSYNNIFVLLLRLRQMCAHILMLQFVMRDLLEVEDLRKIEEVVKIEAANRDTASGHTIRAIRMQLDDLSKKKARQIVDTDEEDSEDDNSPVADMTEGEFDDPTSLDSPMHSTEERQHTDRGFGTKFDFNPFLNSLKSGPEYKQKKRMVKCSWCGNIVKKPWLMSCEHSICKEPCMEDANVDAAERGEEHSTCKTCGTVSTFCHPGEDMQEDEFTDSVSQSTRSQKRKNKQRQRADVQFPKDWLETIDEDLLPSAKTIAVKAQIMNWIKENKDVKIIVFTQFLAMIQIMARVCYKEKWGVEEYTGKMSFAARHKALKKFAENKETRVLLASMQCGGLGLNLTMAQKVILVDPWWNSGAEQQAFCRVFRIGQTEKTYLSRICIKDSIDVHLTEMQERKQKEIDKVMENTGDNDMTMKDFLRLFANIGEARPRRPFNIPDDSGSQDGMPQ